MWIVQVRNESLKIYDEKFIKYLDFLIRKYLKQVIAF